uniref:RNase NYN domain-containing protein n=1 Tax=Rhabditophanes sp. KR3021 TaxID=114890 RepID=A0AC35TW59_9BILA
MDNNSTLPPSTNDFHLSQVQRKLVRVMENEFLFESPCPEALPRVMVLDGCNIARGSCGPQRENRRLDVQFIPVGQSIVKFGKDLFYKCLPNVELIRGYSNHGFMASNNSSLYCTPLDPDYEKVAFRRRFWTKARRMEIVRSIDVLLSKLEEKCRVYDFSSLANTYNPYTSFQFTQMVKSQRMLKVRSVEDLQKKATDANISLSRVAAINSLV